MLDIRRAKASAATALDWSVVLWEFVSIVVYLLDVCDFMGLFASCNNR